MMCSQVFLSPTHIKGFSRSAPVTTAENGQCDLHSLDTNSLNSFTLSVSVCMNDNDNRISERKGSTATAAIVSAAARTKTTPLDVSESISIAESLDETARSFAYSGCDSGFSGTDQWTITSCSSYYPQSSRGSIASVFSVDPTTTSSRKLSIDSAILVDEAISGRNSDSSIQRRILRNISTSFENNLSVNDCIGYISDKMHQNGRTRLELDRRHSEQIESHSNPEIIRKRKGSSKDSLRPPQLANGTQKSRSLRRSKIGLAVCITFSESAEDEMQVFCSEHIALLESMLCRLRASAETAYLNQKKFHQVMLHAWFAATAWLTDLFTAPRILEPIWLTLSNGYSDNPNKLAKYFMNELCWLLNCADTKDTNLYVQVFFTFYGYVLLDIDQ